MSLLASVEVEESQFLLYYWAVKVYLTFFRI